MAIDPITGALAVGGIGSVLGSLFGASGAAKEARANAQAARENRQFTEGKFDLGQLQNLLAAFGPEEGMRIARAVLPKSQLDAIVGRPARQASFTDQQRARLADIDRQLALPTSDRAQAAGVFGRVGGSGTSLTTETRRRLEQERKDLMAAAGGDAGVTGSVGMDAINALGPGYVSQYQTIADQAQRDNAGVLEGFDQQTNQLGALSRRIERQAANYGKQAEDRIRRDSADSLTNANRAAMAALNARGLGASTMLTDALGGNARDNQRAQADALGALGDSQIRLQTGLMGNTLGTLGQRFGGRTHLQSGNVASNANMQTGVVNARQQALTGAAMNPWLGRSNAEFFPGQSASGAALGSLGSSLAGASSPLLGFGLAGMFNQGGGQQAQQQAIMQNAGPGGFLTGWQYR